MKYLILAIVLFTLFVSSASATYYVEGAHVSELDGTDDSSDGAFDIGFQFPFYTEDYTQFYVTTNGIISFGSADSTYSNTVLPSSSYNKPSIFPFWDDLMSYDEQQHILYTTVASGESGNPYGNDVLIVQWTNYGFYGSDLVMGTFQAHLVSDGNITFNYNNLVAPTRAYGQSTTIGIQENGTGNYVQHSYNTDAGIRSKYAINFAYNDGANYIKSDVNTDGFWDILLYKTGTVQPPTQPHDPNPSAGETVSTSPTLSWSCENATNYTVRVSTNADLSSPIYSNSTFIGTSLTLSGLSDETTYYWHIIARNNGGESHSELWNFVTGPVPISNFSANIITGVVPLAVNFSDLSANNPTSWIWDFGDGNTSTDQNTTHVYSSPGIYNVSLNATNTYGSNTVTKTAYIAVYTTPVANFSSNVTSGAAPLTVNFTDISDNNPTSWVWNFGDGNISTDQNPTHTYPNAGTYNVSLVATNLAGNNTLTQNDYITVAITPMANFSADVTSGTAPLSVTFTDTSTNIPTSRLWDFGDGSNSTSQNPIHSYTAAGSYNVTLNATNVAGSNVSTQLYYINVSAAPTTEESSDDDDGVRASVSPGQDPKIVSSSATSVKRITGGSEVNYDLSDSGTPVLGVSFDAKNDEGLVVAKVQVLSSSPEGLPTSSGNSYQMMSIDVGSEGTISSNSADNIQIRFKVSREWIEENNIDVSTIRMSRYHGEQWNDLPTYQEREENGYIYFYAETPGFSIFEVVGDEITATSKQVPASTSVVEEVEEPAEEEASGTPGFTAIAGIVFVSLAILVSRKQK
jgi:PGF-pre-PGF domain-containing protein